MCRTRLAVNCMEWSLMELEGCERKALCGQHCRGVGSAQRWSSRSKTTCRYAQRKCPGSAWPLILAFTLIFRLGQLLPKGAVHSPAGSPKAGSGCWNCWLQPVLQPLWVSKRLTRTRRKTMLQLRSAGNWYGFPINIPVWRGYVSSYSDFRYKVSVEHRARPSGSGWEGLGNADSECLFT